MKDILKHAAIHYALKKIFVTDIDETLIHNTSQATVNMLTHQRYDAVEYAKIEDRRDKTKYSWSFAEWEDRELNIKSILYDEGIERNLEIVREYKARGYDVEFLTSRGGGSVQLEDDIAKALSDRLGFPVKGAALGDYEKYGRDPLPEKKKRRLQQLKEIYDEVIFMDDEDDNLKLAREVQGVYVRDARS